MTGQAWTKAVGVYEAKGARGVGVSAWFDPLVNPGSLHK